MKARYPTLVDLPNPVFQQQRRSNELVSVESLNLQACKTSNKDIWKVGLDYNNKELDVVFGDLKPEHLFGSIFNAGTSDQLNRSIIIPMSSEKMLGRYESGDGKLANELKDAGLGPFSGTINNRKQQMHSIKNSKFKEYLRKYFPKENVIMHPLEEMAKGVFENPRAPTCLKETCKIEELPLPKPPSPTRVSIKEKLLKIADSHSPCRSDSSHTPKESPREIRISRRGRKFLPKIDYLRMMEKEKEENFKTAVEEEVFKKLEQLETPQPRLIRIKTGNASRRQEQSSTYQKRVMDFYIQRKQDKRRMRREDRAKANGQSAIFDGSSFCGSIDQSILSVVKDLPPQFQPIKNHRSQSIELNKKLPPSVRVRSDSLGYMRKNSDGSIPRTDSVSDLNLVNVNSTNTRDLFPLNECKSYSFSRESTPRILVKRQSVQEIQSRNATPVTAGDTKNLSKLGTRWKSINNCVSYAQACLIRALLPQIAEYAKMGSPVHVNPFCKLSRFKPVQAVVLKPEFIQKLKNCTSAEYNHASRVQTKSYIVLLPRWEQRFMGLKLTSDGRKVVVGCKEPPSNLKSWFPARKTDRKKLPDENH